MATGNANASGTAERPRDVREIQEALARPFEDWQVLTRDENGRSYDYVEDTTIMERFDEVLGIDGWRHGFMPVENGVMCTIEVYFGPERGWIGKTDAAGYPEMVKKAPVGKDTQGKTLYDKVPDVANSTKGGYTQAFRRAARCWGVARYLYNKAERRQRERGGNGNAPAPRSSGRDDRQQQPQPQPRRSHTPSNSHSERDDAPRNGKALCAWLNNRGRDVFQYVEEWGQSQRYPRRFVDWSPEQVSDGYAEAQEFLAAPVGAGAGGGY